MENFTENSDNRQNGSRGGSIPPLLTNFKFYIMTTEKTIWMGTVEDIFGYGISVVADSHMDCLRAIEEAYNEWCDGSGDDDDYGDMYHDDGTPWTRFEKAMDYWGMSIREIELGRTYYDNFKE